MIKVPDEAQRESMGGTVIIPYREPLPCPDPDCEGVLVLRYSERKRNFFYGCTRWPECKETHSAHQSSLKPMGDPANAQTRVWRRRAHEVFDAYWRRMGMKRKDAYAWMQEIMGLSPKEGHIGKFTQEQCQKLINLIQDIEKEDQDE